jgi:hypothetical protein
MEWFYELLLNCYGCINNGTVVTRHSQSLKGIMSTKKPSSFPAESRKVFVSGEVFYPKNDKKNGI